MAITSACFVGSERQHLIKEKNEEMDENQEKIREDFSASDLFG